MVSTDTVYEESDNETTVLNTFIFITSNSYYADVRPHNNC